MATSEVSFSPPQPWTGAEHILYSRSCTVNGYATYGYRMECTICGAVDETAHCSSVTAADWSSRFANEHKRCDWLADRLFAVSHANDYALSAGAFMEEAQDFANWVGETFMPDQSCSLRDIPPLPVALRRFEEQFGVFAIHRPL